ncbi:hypothetical protein [Namhaeicola litoreus]|uniref:Gliding motility protein GldL n=1 Tax=Namhaeicola litoreus TaxID=1052145 RepID=A0ABW3Y1V0_9FLAO
MKNQKLIFSFLSYGVFLIIIGLLGYFFEWRNATIFLGLGFVFELMALILFAWKKVRKNS